MRYIIKGQMSSIETDVVTPNLIKSTGGRITSRIVINAFKMGENLKLSLKAGWGSDR